MSDELTDVIAELRALVAAQSDQIDRLQRRMVELEGRGGEQSAATGSLTRIEEPGCRAGICSAGPVRSRQGWPARPWPGVCWPSRPPRRPATRCSPGTRSPPTKGPPSGSTTTRTMRGSPSSTRAGTGPTRGTSRRTAEIGPPARTCRPFGVTRSRKLRVPRDLDERPSGVRHLDRKRRRAGQLHRERSCRRHRELDLDRRGVRAVDEWHRRARRWCHRRLRRIERRERGPRPVDHRYRGQRNVVERERCPREVRGVVRCLR